MAKQMQQKINKPEKVLNASLQKRKEILEEKDWVFLQEAETKWNAQKVHNGQTVETGAMESFKYLLNAAEEFEKFWEEEKQKATTDLEIRNLDLDQLIPSPLETQTRRRERLQKDKKIYEEYLDSLGNSITKTKGVLQPILVRPRKDLAHKFEIVFGERRFDASKFKGLKKIRCFIRELSDTEVVELQYDENHERRENHPLDDAFTFLYLINKKGYTVEQLADRFNTSKKEVTEKLKLNDLIPEAVQELSDGVLPLRHAYYLAKFSPDVQKTIVTDELAYEYGNKADGACSYAEFKEAVEEEIIRKLADAPFDTEDSRLHLKGLKCSDCVENSNYSPLLFPDWSDGDRCLNKKCFEFKTNVSMRLKRDEIAENISKSGGKSIEESVKEVPLVTDKNWIDKNETPFTEKVLTNQKIYEKPECDDSQSALAVKGDKKGQEVYICQNKDCPVHNKKPAVEFYQRQNLEAEFNVKVGLAVREEIFAEAIRFFDKGVSFWEFADLVEKLLCNSLFSKRDYLLKSLKKLLKTFPKCPANFDDAAKTAVFVAGLAPFQQSQLLFLCTFADLGYMSWRPEPQDGVKQLAKDYAPKAIDYEVLDAKKRVELAPDEFKAIAKDYLIAVLKGKKSEIPRFWAKENVEGDE